MLSFARCIRNSQEFYDKKNSIPADAFENLSWLVEGFSLDEVKSLVKEDHEGESVSDSFAEALENPETLKSFVVVDREDELRRIMSEPLEKWRVFLHPTQRKIVKKYYSGDARILGGAVTGKTVVAMHRARQLAKNLNDKERILFTT